MKAWSSGKIYFRLVMHATVVARIKRAPVKFAFDLRRERDRERERGGGVCIFIWSLLGQVYGPSADREYTASGKSPRDYPMRWRPATGVKKKGKKACSATDHKSYHRCMHDQSYRPTYTRPSLREGQETTAKIRKVVGMWAGGEVVQCRRLRAEQKQTTQVGSRRQLRVGQRAAIADKVVG